MNAREFTLKTLTDLSKVKPAHEIREMALGWHSRGVLTEDDLATIEGLLPSYGTTLEEAQATRQALNKQALANWLAAHPLTWTDGKVYGVEEEDQQEMISVKQRYEVKQALGKECVVEWHTKKNECHVMELADFLALADAIGDYVYPYCRHQEAIKKQIYAAQTVEAVKAIPIDYSTVGQEEEEAPVNA